LLHFINASPEIFGFPLLILFLTGTGIYVYRFFSEDKKHRWQTFLEIWILVVPVLLIFAVHSVLYWKALYGSMGLVRVVTGVLPVAAIVSAKAFDHIEKTFLKKKISRIVFLSLVIVSVIVSNFLINRYPVQCSPGEHALKSAIRWIKKTPMAKQKIFYTDIDVPFLLDLDPYDKTKCEQKVTTKWLLCFPENTVIIWDSYYGLHECYVPLAVLEKSGAYILRNIFRPEQSQKAGYEEPYEICIFTKAPPGIFIDNKAIRDSITTTNNTEIGAVRFITGDTFEKNSKGKDDPHTSDEVARSGSFSYKANSWEEFISPYEIDLSKIISKTENVTILVTCYVYPVVPFKDNDTRLVITLKDRNEFYHSLPLGTFASRINKWNKVSFAVTFPVIKPDDRLVVYFWHLGKKEFFIDDLKIETGNP
jgi:hypothetical protein